MTAQAPPLFYVKNFFAGPEIGIFNISTENISTTSEFTGAGTDGSFYTTSGTIENDLSLKEQQLSPLIRRICSENYCPGLESQEFIELLYFMIGANYSACHDLHIKVLKNNTNHPLICSDRPVLLHNQFLAGRGWIDDLTDFGNKGIQIIQPLDSKTAVIFYDGWTYRVGNKKDNVIELTVDDVHHLNAQQVAHCQEEVYFTPPVKEYFLKLWLEQSKRPINEKLSVRLSPVSLTKQAKEHILNTDDDLLRPYTLYRRNSR
jgi:hypothetical protein